MFEVVVCSESSHEVTPMSALIRGSTYTRETEKFYFYKDVEVRYPELSKMILNG